MAFFAPLSLLIRSMPARRLRVEEVSQVAQQKGKMTVSEAGRKGGKTTSKKYGHEFYEKIGEKGGETTARKYGPEFYEKIGGKGGEATARKYGPEFYEEIGHKGGQKVKRLIEEGKKRA